MTKDSVSVDAGLSVGDRVTAGTFLGCEDDVGCASGEHLHFEVALPEDPGNPIDSDGFLVNGNADNRIPRICELDGDVFVEGERYVAGRCQPLDRLLLEPILHVMRA
jgi:murein DD-endopeptidase MepM/ murein hydrolase activator NlpD